MTVVVDALRRTMQNVKRNRHFVWFTLTQCVTHVRILYYHWFVDTKIDGNRLTLARHVGVISVPGWSPQSLARYFCEVFVKFYEPS